MKKKFPDGEPPRGDDKLDREEQPVPVDVVRLTIALRGPFATMPAGLTREEKREYILSHAK
ncbi:hypothetical protein [Burkholderia gladioli]|uniref:hypothetical protein n=1 Tax=Burkholderia gladioli TaxID=28095 RepID=UPI00163EB302|nr:hypothetical protein [Burkholderia gladioli]